MRVRYAVGLNETRGFNTTELRTNVLINSFFASGTPCLLNLRFDRVIVGDGTPVAGLVAHDR